LPERKIDTTQNKVYVRALDTYEYDRVQNVLVPLLDALLAETDKYIMPSGSFDSFTITGN